MLSPEPGHDPGTSSADWRARARCRDISDPEIFFPTAESGRLLEAGVAEARKVCAGCPVTEQCLAFAREWLPYGIAAGLTPAERRRNAHGRPRRRARASFDGRHSETAEAGRAALRAGARPVDVAREFGVSDRTVSRWGAANRAEGDAAAASAAATTATPETTVGRGVA